MVACPDGLLMRIGQIIRRDMQRFILRMQALGDAKSGPGLFTYRINTTDGKVRLHLRIHPDRTGLLFVNATQTLHLPPTTAEMAKLILDGTPPALALAQLRLSYPDVSPQALKNELEEMSRAIAILKQPTNDCAICQVGWPQPPPFSVRAQAPYKADLALHYTCNNNCSHCYNEPGRKQMPSLPAADWKRVLDKLLDIGVPYVIFTGGEPTLHPDLVPLISYAESQGQITGLNTNGRRLADPSLTADLAAAGLDHVQVTLNSHHPQLHNQIVGAKAFHETVAGIRCALDTGLHTLTNTTLISENASEAVEMVDFLYGLGIRTFAMNGMIHSGCGTRHPSALEEWQLSPILEQVRNRAAEYGMRFLWYTPTEYCRLSPVDLGLGIHCCNAAEYSVCIEPNGDVLPCQSYYVAAGNILRDPWEQIWDSELFRSFRYRREHPKEAGLPERCWDCEQLSICGGGCPLERAAHRSEVINV